MKTLALVLSVAALAACSDRQPPADTTAPAEAVTAEASEAEATSATPAATVDGTSTSPVEPSTPADAAKIEADYLGRWTGVEGMYLVVASKPGGGVTLDMQWDLDNKGNFDGSVTAEGLRFMRNDVAETALHTDGDATGLKYLAGKKDCLTVKPGEGYCRD